MKKRQIIEAWRDEDYFLGLSEEERAALPAHPAGVTSVKDEALRSVAGGCSQTSAMCTPCPPRNCY